MHLKLWILVLCDECTSSDFISQHPESISYLLSIMAKTGLHVIVEVHPTRREGVSSKYDSLGLPLTLRIYTQTQDTVGKNSTLQHNPSDHSTLHRQATALRSIFWDWLYMAEGPSLQDWRSHCHRNWSWSAGSTGSRQARGFWVLNPSSCSALTAVFAEFQIHSLAEFGDSWILTWKTLHHWSAGVSVERDSHILTCVLSLTLRDGRKL